MSLPRLWGCCIVLVLLPGTPTLGCDVPATLRSFPQESVDDLFEMGEAIPPRCEAERSSLDVDSLNLADLTAGGQDLDTAGVVYQVVSQFNVIYHLDRTSVTWSQDAMRKFGIKLDTQTSILENCVRNAGSDAQTQKKATIQEYFRKLSEFLNRERFSACAWEVIREEITPWYQQLYKRYVA